MIYLLYFGTIVFNLIKKRGKSVAIISFFTMWVMMGWSSGNADYSLYVRWYDGYSFYNKEILYTFLEFLFHRLNFSYELFLIVMSGTCIALRLLLIFRLSNVPGFIIAMYMLFPFPLDITQIRMFYGTSIVLWGMQYLLKENKQKQDIAKYLICIILATCIHSACIVYILFLFCLVDFKKMGAIIAAGLLVEVIAFKNIKYILIMANFLGMGEKVLSTLNNHSNSASYKFAWRACAILAVCQIIILIINNLMKKRLCSGMYTEKEYTEYKKISDFVVKSNLICFIIIPAYQYSVDLHRIYYQIILFVWILVGKSLLIHKNNWKEYKINIPYILISLFMCILFWYTNIYRLYLEAVWMPMLDNNRLF